MVLATRYIGLMSGTSADAVDLVVVDFTEEGLRLIGQHSLPLPPNLRQEIHTLSLPGSNEIDCMGMLDRRLGLLFADAVHGLLHKYHLSPKAIAAIGSHGQTIRHRPPGSISYPFTLQIGDPNLIAQLTGITTVADFRRRDMAVGGHGAPLVPAFHRAIFQSATQDRVLVNIGGMANLTFLPVAGTTVGFDTGPGNVLMDAWIQRHTGKAYDAHGDWAASGAPNKSLLARMLAHPYFQSPPPKSTGRELFNLAWVEQQISTHLRPEDVQATLLKLTAVSIARDIQGLCPSGEIFICGGGAYNTQLIKSLQQLLPAFSVKTTQDLGIAPEWIEAMAFAWLARQTLLRQPGNLCAVTGASEEVILGGVYFA